MGNPLWWEEGKHEGSSEVAVSRYTLSRIRTQVKGPMCYSSNLRIWGFRKRYLIDFEYLTLNCIWVVGREPRTKLENSGQGKPILQATVHFRTLDIYELRAQRSLLAHSHRHTCFISPSNDCGSFGNYAQGTVSCVVTLGSLLKNQRRTPP
jgi:hypothetical protein